ncbi:MAG: WecB/TagA/CpsF family glycosyltransferase [Proteobacteria bacterium]|nr:WecB/TagA/CpsF family glycosyltransferase [Pseudomonadota bacterium]
MSQKFRLGYAVIDRINLQEAVQSIVAFAQNRPCRFVVTPNSDHIIQLENNKLLRDVYQAASLVVADGMPLVWASNLLSTALPERVTGSELMPRVCAEAARLQLRVFILGGPPGVAERAGLQLQQEFSGINVCGTGCPPFGFEKDPETEASIIANIEKTQPDIIFVGLGAPKQELWMYRHHSNLNAGVMLGVGAALEFSAGTLKRAPPWMQRLGAEWLFRLWQDPKRLAPRYLRDTGIVWIVLREFFRKTPRA